MKFRTGFVSNSSSSSFLIYGAHIENLTENNTILQKMVDKSKDGKYPVTLEKLEVGDTWDLGERLADLLPIEYNAHYIEYESGVFIGVAPENQDDDMKHGDWKAMIRKDLEDVLEETGIGCGWYEDCSYNG